MAVKTNAMRMLDQKKIHYELKLFPPDQKASQYLHRKEEQIFKTLVTTDTKKGYYVFVIPTNEELDLKKAAQAVGVKRIEMLKQKDLLPLTGYVHGGCSPIGMKKVFLTILDTKALNFETIICSAGKIGTLMEIRPQDIQTMVRAKFENVIKG